LGGITLTLLLFSNLATFGFLPPTLLVLPLKVGAFLFIGHPYPLPHTVLGHRLRIKPPLAHCF
jgi:hypothetical protein